MDVKVKADNIKFKFRVSGIIIEDNKVLVDRYDDKSYCLPGGYVNVGETSEEAIIRELKEEIDLDFIIDSFVGVDECFFNNRKGVRTQAIDFYYKMSFKNKDDINNIDYDRVEDDHGKIVNHHFTWIDLNEVNNNLIRPEQIKDVIVNDIRDFHYIIIDD